VITRTDARWRGSLLVLKAAAWARGDGSVASFLGQTNAVASEDGRDGDGSAHLRKSSDSTAVSWCEARVGGSILIQKFGREASLYRDFSPNNS
jgi:hypothetical protein